MTGRPASAQGRATGLAIRAPLPNQSLDEPPVGPHTGALVRRPWVVLDVTTHLAGFLRGAEPTDQVERHVDTGRNARGGDHLAAVDEAFIGARDDVAAERQEFVERAPIGRRRPTVEEAGIGVDKRARADAGHEGPAVLQLAQPRACLLIPELRSRAAAAGVNEYVDVAELAPGCLRDDAHAFGAGDRGGALPDHHDVDVVGTEVAPGGQHLP